MESKHTYRVTVAVTHITFKNVVATSEQEAKTIAASLVNSEMYNTRIPAYQYEGITMIVPDRKDDNND